MMRKGFRYYYYDCAKSVHIRSYSGPYFPEFGLNTERYSHLIQSEYGKIRTRIIPNTDNFYPVYSSFFSKNGDGSLKYNVETSVGLMSRIHYRLELHLCLKKLRQMHYNDFKIS